MGQKHAITAALMQLDTCLVTGALLPASPALGSPLPCGSTAPFNMSRGARVSRDGRLSLS